MEKTSLSDLCAVCHTQPPKYRCPRCRTPTCSLPCSQRHKQRASCNGRRDPTTYVRKSQWATPAGLDHDYNYLRSVEKSISNAGEDAQARGIAVPSPPTGRRRRAPNKNGTALESYLIENRISVDHAPVGMQRQKTNRTRVSARRNVLWTVEWVLPDGSRRVSHDSIGSETLGECFERVRVESWKSVEGSKALAGNKRKRAKAKAAMRRDGGRFIGQESSLPTDGKEMDGGAQPDRRDQSNRPEHPEQPHVESDSDTSSASIQIITDAPTPSSPSPNLNPLTYYLLKPSTTSQSPVLIPLQPSTTLTDALRDRVVQEFPTIYAFQPSASEGLPAGFVLEEEYLQSLSRKAEGSGERADASGGAKARAMEGGKGEPKTKKKELDASSILEMLRRDVSR